MTALTTRREQWKAYKSLDTLNRKVLEEEQPASSTILLHQPGRRLRHLTSLVSMTMYDLQDTENPYETVFQREDRSCRRNSFIHPLFSFSPNIICEKDNTSRMQNK